MKLQSKKARVPIAALGVTALVCGAGALVGPSAFAAPTAIGLSSGATTPSVANVGSATAAAANAAYAFKISDASIATVAAVVESAPTAGRAALLQVASNGAATTNFPGVGNSEVQTVTISGTPAGGTFTLSFGGQTTATIAYNATGATVTTALEALSTIGAGNVVVAGGAGGPYTATFGSALSATNVAEMTANGSGLTGGTSPSVAVATTTQGASTGTALGTVLNTDYLYLTGSVPGTYKIRLFQDSNANLVYDAADERGSDPITLTVYDAGGPGTTATTSDDVAPVISANSPVNIGRAVTAGITYSKSLSLTDARGSGVATGLAGRLAALTAIDVAPGTTGVTLRTDQAASYSTTDQKITYAVGSPATSGTIGIRADLKPSLGATDNVSSFGAKSVEVTASTVTTLVLAATDVTGSVKTTGSAVAVKAGTGAVTYTAKATAAGPTNVAGATVYFTLAGDNVADLTTDGTPVDGESHVYTAITNASGIATLKVTSSATADTDAYSVDADSGGIDNGTDLAVTYAAPAAAAIINTNTVAELTPEITATSTTLKGKLEDQFGAAYTPAPSSPQQVTVQVPDGTTSGFATISDGTFSYVYTPAVAPTAGTTTTFDFLYGALSDGATQGGTIRYASTTAASSVTLTTPAAGASSVDIQDSTTPVSAQSNTGTVPFGNLTGEVTGTVLDTTGSGLAYKTVTLTGSDGVYFSTATAPTTAAADDLVKTITVVSSNSGVFGGAYAYFTKAGAGSVKATVGTVSKEAAVTVDAATEGWKITVNDVTGTPGSTLIVTGTLKDAFENPVPSTSVELGIGDSTLGAFGDSTPGTNSAGIFSTTFTSGSNQSGTADLTAKIFGLTTNPTVSVDYETNAGLTIPHGEYQDTAKITLTASTVTLQATAKLMGGGSAKISGTFMPNTGVDIYAKASGAASYSLLDSVTTDDEGEYGAAYTIKKTTSFLAKSAGLSSKVDTTQVYSTVTLTAKSYSKSRATLSANGSPSAKGTLTFYRSVAGKDPILKSMTSNASGNGTVTVKLPKGTRSVYVIFKAPGTGAGTSKTVKVKVK